MSDEYIRGLKDAVALCDARPTAYAFAAAADIRAAIAEEESRPEPVGDGAASR